MKTSSEIFSINFFGNIERIHFPNYFRFFSESSFEIRNFSELFLKQHMTIVLDDFASRHWDDPNYTGARITNMNKQEFIEYVRDYISQHGGFQNCSVEGYAPFCRHVFIENPTDAHVDSIEITPDIEKLIKSGYHSRRSDELPVLCRWIEARSLPNGIPIAKYLDLIFYSREQLIAEAKDMNLTIQPGEWDWGLISIKGQMIAEETPMQPITAMRNALGREYGRSSVPIDEAKYRKSVEYWQKYISIQ